MKELICTACGSTKIKKEGNYYICEHCGTKMYPTKDDQLSTDSNIDLNEDVKRLLKLIEDDPINKKKYAQLIIQIDSSNKIARDIINSYNKKSGCYVATCVYGSYDCPQVWTLRRYRDFKLSNTWYGRLFIKIYYFISPTIVKLFGRYSIFKGFWKPVLDKKVNNLRKEGYQDSPYQDIEW